MVQPVFGNRVELNPGLGGVREVASAIIFHEQTQSNRSCYFQTSDAELPKNLFSDYLQVTAAGVVPCGGPKMSPRTSIQCYVYIFWSVGIFGFNVYFGTEWCSTRSYAA